MLLYATKEQTEKCGKCVGQATVFIVGRQAEQFCCGSTDVCTATLCSGLAQCGNTATTLFVEVFEDGLTIYSPVVTICTVGFNIQQF